MRAFAAPSPRVARNRRLQSAFAVALLALLTGALPLRVDAQAHVLIVSGLGGEKKFVDRFRTLAGDLAGALHSRFGIPDSEIVWVGEDSVVRDNHYRGRSTSAAIERELKAMRARAKPGEQVAIFFIGHGAGSESESRVSLPGPDLTVLDLQRLLATFNEQRVAIAVLTSGSGDMLPLLVAPNRVVITATKSSYERNESHFAEHFVSAFANDVADTDKDDRVSLLEAFTYAARETKRLYDDATKIQTEHAQLSDDGSKQGTGEPNGRQGQGMLARRYFFDARAAAAVGDAQLTALYHEKDTLEEAVEALRLKKQAMDSAAYETELERVLVALSRKAREIRTAEGRP